MTEYRFTGRERVTIEIAGAFDAAAVALPAGLVHDGGRASLFAFAVDGLRIAGVPLARWSYPELLWRVAVRRAGEPAWWVVACDLAAPGPRWAARRYVRYDVRPFAVAVDDGHVRSRGPAGELALAIAATSEPAPVERRPLHVGPDAGWRVPWGDDDTPAVRAEVRVEQDSLSQATLGTPVTWLGAILRRGRWHRCGVAQR